MTKHVVNNSMVAHLWAHQSQDNARSGNGNYYFQGRTLFNYSTPIGNIVDGADGQKVALFPRENYSPTTAQRIGDAWAAVTGVMPGYFVPHIGVSGGRSPRLPENFHEENRDHLVAAYLAEVASHKRARKIGNETYLTRLAREATSYCAAFGLEAPALDLAQDIAAIQALNTPETIAKREAQAAKRRERTERDISAWRAGLMNWRITPQLGTMLRVRGDVIQTSQGAEFPIAHAVHAFPFIVQVRQAGAEWRPNGRTIHLGPFTIDCIEADGSVRAGCHYVKFEEIALCAKTLTAQPKPPNVSDIWWQAFIEALCH